jgi:hypothetical protein
MSTNNKVENQLSNEKEIEQEWGNTNFEFTESKEDIYELMFNAITNDDVDEKPTKPLLSEEEIKDKWKALEGKIIVEFTYEDVDIYELMFEAMERK